MRLSGAIYILGKTDSIYFPDTQEVNSAAISLWNSVGCSTNFLWGYAQTNRGLITSNSTAYQLSLGIRTDE